MKRRCHLFLVMLLSLFILAPGAERSVIYLRLADSQTFDPGKVEDFYSQEVIFNIFEGLVRLRANRMEVEPCLAERWLSRENGKHWVFYLRRGVTFHNGEALTAAVVVESFKKRLARRSGEYASFGRFFPYIQDVRALDPWTVEFLLSRSYSQFLLALVDMRAFIVAPASSAGKGFTPIGTGPFALAEWTKGRLTVLSRFDRYWGTPARLAKVVFKYEPNSALRLSQIRNRSADIDLIRSAKEYDELRSKPWIGIISEPSLSTQFLGFNCRRPPFSALPARKAFSHLLNKRILVKQTYQNFAIPASGMLPPNAPGYDAQLGRDDVDLAKAGKLLDEAGLGKGFSCRLYFSEGQFGLEDIAKAITVNARRVGIDVISTQLPFGKLLAAVREGEPDLFLLGWGYVSDPGIYMNPLFMLYPGDRRNTLSASPAFVKLLADAEAMADDDQREEIYAAAQRRLHDDMPLIPLFYLNHVLAYSKRLRNLSLNPFGFLDFKGVYPAVE